LLLTTNAVGSHNDTTRKTIYNAMGGRRKPSKNQSNATVTKKKQPTEAEDCHKRSLVNTGGCAAGVVMVASCVGHQKVRKSSILPCQEPFFD
jgi:hypothetical protein